MVATLRNMERLITAQVGGGREAHRFFRAIASGEVSVEGAIEVSRAGAEEESDPPVGALVLGAASGAAGSDDDDDGEVAGEGAEMRRRWEDTVAKARAALSMVLLPEQARYCLHADAFTHRADHTTPTVAPATADRHRSDRT